MTKTINQIMTLYGAQKPDEESEEESEGESDEDEESEEEPDGQLDGRYIPIPDDDDF